MHKYNSDLFKNLNPQKIELEKLPGDKTIDKSISEQISELSKQINLGNKQIELKDLMVKLIGDSSDIYKYLNIINKTFFKEFAWEICGVVI